MTAAMIRPARAGELPLLLLLEEQAAQRFRGTAMEFVLHQPPPPPDAYAQILEKGLLFVIEQDARLAGFLAAIEMPGALHVVEVSVHPDCGGRGFARALIVHAADIARSRYLPALTLTTDREIPWNGPLWAKLGFRDLAADERPDWLGKILEAERDAGFDETRRVAMIRPT